MLTDKMQKLSYEIRGKQVFLDQDIARLFKCKNGTKSLHLAVKRNRKKFPKDFYFQLTEEEYYKIKKDPKNIDLHFDGRSLPIVFTNSGVLMLMTLLNTDIAIQESIHLISTLKSF